MRGLAVVLGVLTSVVVVAPVGAQTAAGDLADPAGVGQYAVGATSRNFQRAGLTGQRGLLTYIWYPALPGSGPVDPNLEAVVDAAPNATGGPYPVITWSHGYTGSP